jgi:hypothetical protein
VETVAAEEAKIVELEAAKVEITTYEPAPA